MSNTITSPASAVSSEAVSEMFSETELSILAAFYAGERARSIRQRTGIDPWPVVARHRGLDKDSYRDVIALLERRGEPS